MKFFSRSLTVSFGGIILFMFLVSCTSGKAQARNNSYSDRDNYEQRADVSVRSENNSFEDEFDKRDDRALDADDNRRKHFVRSTEEPRNTGDSRRVSDNRYSRKYSEKQDSEKRRDFVNYAEKRENFYQTGMASWYGREFHGKITASGEKFNMNTMTAAHKTLPFGTILEVKNLKNGKSVRVRVNDRGPYHGKRILDLSYAAAKNIGIISSGESNVGINVLKRSQPAAKKSRYAALNVEPVADNYIDDSVEENSSADLIIQAGAFYSQKNAIRLKRKIQGFTNNSVIIVNDGELYKVRIEGLSTKSHANRFKRILSNENISSFIIDSRD